MFKNGLDGYYVLEDIIILGMRGEELVFKEFLKFIFRKYFGEVLGIFFLR